MPLASLLTTRLQEPEKAVNAFVSAMEYSPKDTELILRIARARVTTHDYSGSIDFYNKVTDVCVCITPLSTSTIRCITPAMRCVTPRSTSSIRCQICVCITPISMCQK